MAVVSSSDIAILSVGVILAAVYLFRDQLFTSKPKSAPVVPSKGAASHGSGDPRDFVTKMKEGVGVFRFARSTDPDVACRKNG